MATINLGAIKFNWKGAYNSGTAYAVDDVVSSGGSSYVCILASTGNAVSNGTYWELMAQAGTNGTDGATIPLTTQGDILYRDGSGLQRLAKGTASQELRMNSGATAPEWHTPAVASSDFVKLYATKVEYNSGVSYATYQNYFTNDYDHYKIIIMDTGSTGGGVFGVQLGGGGIDTGSNYIWQGNSTQNSSHSSHGSTGDSLIRIGWNGDGSFKNTTVLDLVNARNTGVQTHLHAQRFSKDNASWTLTNASGYWNATTAVDKIRFTHTAGTIQINSIAIYGYKTS